MKQKLGPCPFCGAKYGDDHDDGCFIPMSTAVIVNIANGNPPLYSTEQLAEAWNTRYEPTCHWEHTDHCTWTCSNCGVETDVLYRYWLHCPVCGAKVVE